MKARAALTALLVSAALGARREAAAACPSTGTPAVLSEARAARWLLGDDLQAQAALDQHRAVVAGALAEHGLHPPTIEVFSHASLGYQSVFRGFSVCSDQGEMTASLERWRLAGTAGVTHTPTQLQLRVSVVGARDQLSVGDLGSDQDDSSEAGYQQGVVAVRAGHARWGRALVGFVSPESPYQSPGGGVTLSPRLAPTAGKVSVYYGLSVPALHTHLLVLAHSRLEVVQLVSSDLPLGPLPLAVSVGPTYVREERQAIGLLRVRGRSADERSAPRPRTWLGEGAEELSATDSRRSGYGPLFEASAEAAGTRLRHARLRFDGFHQAATVVDGGGHHEFLRVAGFVEGTVFRSRFFEEAITRASGAVRGAAWGGGAGALLEVDFSPFALVVDGALGVNRPELLSLMPSSADRLELRGGFTVRVEN